MKKGFTLIELLAVIIVLAVISLIATPALINVIEEAKDKSDLESVHGILDSARLFYSESMMNSESRNDIENLNNIYEKVSLSVKEKTGELYINDKGLSAVAIVIRNKCYTKKFTGDIKITKDINNCTLGFIGKDEIPPTVTFSVEDGVFNSNNWAKNNFNVNITISDNESGPSSYKYCIDTNICEPIALVNKSTGFSEINSESLTNKVCVIGIDNYGNESEIICSDDYKLDKTNPTITVDNISINKNTVIDLSSDITTRDTLSGVDNVTYDPTNIDTSVAGDKKVTYTVTDKAGNSSSLERTITVITDKPTVNFTTLTNPNSNGWFNSDFYIKATASVDNTTSVRSIKWCSSTSECVPTTVLESDNVTGYISTNSISNKMCVQITDQTGNESDVICSDDYKLDKINPTISVDNISINKNTVIDLNSDITTNDTLSGVNNVTYDPTNIDTSIAGDKKVTYTVTDKAGNSASIERTITVITDKPTVNFTTLTNPNGNGWFNSDFYIKAMASVDNTTSVRSIKWCSSTSECSPVSVLESDNVTGYISTNSISNKMCVQITDQTGNESNVICSNNYKLDSIAPTVPTLDFNGYIPGNWTNQDVIVTSNSTDDLSGVSKYEYTHNGSNFTEWNENPKQWVINDLWAYIQIRAIDNAGNVSISTQQYLINIDKVLPVHTNWWWGEATSAGASLYVQTTDNVAIQRVQCPTSTETGGYSNWYWFNGVWDAGANAYRCDITSSTFGHYGNYITHLYIYDYAGNGGYYNQTSINIKKPILSNNSVAPVNYTTGSDTRSREILAYMVKSDGTLWYESRGYNPGIFQVGGISDVVGVSNVNYTTGSDTRSREILAYIVKSDGTLWYESRGYNPGIFQVGGISDVVGVSNVNYTTGSGTRSSEILTYVVKSDGTLWYERSGYNPGWFQVGGISDVVGVTSVHYTTGSSTRSSEILAYAVKSDGTLWYESSGYNNGWFQVGGISNVVGVSNVNYTTGSSTRSSEILVYIVKSDGTLWYESRGYNSGIFQVGGINNVAGVSNVNYTTGSGTSSSEILSYVVKSDGTLWYERSGYNPGWFQTSSDILH